MKLRRFLQVLLIVAVVVAVVPGAWFLMKLMDPRMRGPRGYYVQKEDPTVYIEFFEKPNARSNVVRKFGEAEYTFDAFDREIDMHGPSSAPTEEQRHYKIDGEEEEIRVQDLSAKPVGPERIFPVTHYTRTKK